MVPGTDYLTPSAFWSRAGFEPAKAATQPLLQTEQEGQVAQRAARPPVTTNRLRPGLVRLGHHEPTPIVHQVQERPHTHQGVVLARKVRRRARPPPPPRATHQVRSYRVPFDVSGARQEVRLVHDERGEPALPQVPSPAFAEC